jgi:hypothetical protein
MPFPFDATLKELARSHPHDVEQRLNLGGPAPLRLLNVDLSTLTAATDVVFGYGEPLRHIIDIHFQGDP